MPEDFYSIDLTSAYASLGKIIGEEVDEDVEIALAVLERRQAQMEDRGSPAKSVLVGGND